MEAGKGKLYTKMTDALEVFITQKEKDLRPDTLRSYNSFCRIFGQWTMQAHPNCMTSTFTRELANDFLNYIYYERNVSAISHNNYMKLARTFFNWMTENGYTAENPFEKIKPKRTNEKKRILIPQEARQTLANYLKEHDRELLLACELVFYSLIRPKEISAIRIEHLHLEENYITIPGDTAKNHHTRRATISDEAKAMIDERHPELYPQDYYLFGSHGKPSAVKIDKRRFGKRFADVRNRLKLPKEMQLYSFRDTGITEMIKSGLDDLTVMQHADHSDLKITSRYAKHADNRLTERIRSSGLKF